MTELPVEVLRAMPGVVEVQRDREAVVIHTSRPEDVLRRLLQLDLEVSGIEVSSAGLEEAFLALTRSKATAERLARA